MMETAMSPRLPANEARLPHLRAALFMLALGVSLAVHALAFLELPPLPGLALMQKTTERPTRPMQMQDVRPTPDRPAYDAPAKFRPEDPASFTQVASRQDELLQELRAEAEAAPDFAPSAPAEAPAPLPAKTEEVEATDFRQDILRIEQQQAARELESLPRVIQADIPRVSGAPDITLAADTAAIAAAAASVAGAVPSSALSVPSPTLAAPAPDEVWAATVPAETDLQDRLKEQAALLNETAAEITEITPIEQVLEVAVTVYRASDENAVYFEAAIARSGVESLPVIPKDVLLVQDCSESMTRSKLDFFKEGIVEYLRTLTTVDRVNIMRYSDTPELCFDDWRPVTAESLQEAARFTDAMRARGATDLFGPLQQILKIPRHPGRPMLVVLMTDGRPTLGTVDSSDIIARFSKMNKGNVSVFTIGAGDRVNRFLLDLLGHDNRGASWIRPLREQIPEAVSRAGRELSRPVLTDLSYRFSGDSEAEVYPGRLTHLFLDRPLRLVGRCPADHATAVLQILGDSGGRPQDMVFELDLQQAEEGGEGIRREWVMQKIYRLINDHLISGREDTLREIRALSVQYNVPLLYGDDFPAPLP